ncbi:FMN-linked oxidoreductase [Mycena alexandri]|uniref:tRNA-dihydrouridine synthase n=1 Tax=Mycena alexandri TaxID=1745969 RepID=A0AAD6T649_9AGAR|nr:FMN-linked oxidoreductase [Mycena alexandri]
MLSSIAAPMVNQSDLPFRVLVQRYGATLAYTQMLNSDALLGDQDYLGFHLRDLTMEPSSPERPVVVQLCGNDAETIVRAGKKIQNYCQGIGAGDQLARYLHKRLNNFDKDLNLGCPQQSALEAHFGAYLLGQKDWPLVEEIVSAMHNSFTVPVSTKLRLVEPAPKTLDLGQRLEGCGASWLTLHARTVSARRRRHGAADLSQVKRLKDNLRVPVVSNGNVRVWDDLAENLRYTGADGLMVGETLLGNPCLFANQVPDPVTISLEYIAICREYPETAPLTVITTHVKHFIDFQCRRRPWHNKFRTSLGACKTLDDIERLLRVKVERWRGRAPRTVDADADDGDFDEENQPGEAVEDFGSLFLE